MKSEIKGDFGVLDTLVKTLAKGDLYVKVGIMGSKNSRKDGGMTNANLGAIHEFGFPPGGIPPRSFLRMPLQHQANQILKDASVGMLALLTQGKLVMVLKRLGLACENAIQLAFATRGFNLWRPNLLSTIARKGSNSPLIDTAQLRRSITSKVEASQ